MKRELGLVLLTGTLVFMATSSGAQKPAAEEAPRMLRCTGLEIVDPQGNPRIKLFLTKKGDAQIHLLGPAPAFNPLITLSATDFDANISVGQPKGDRVLSITNSPVLSAFQVYDEKTPVPHAEMGLTGDLPAHLRINSPSTETSFNVWTDDQWRTIIQMGSKGRKSELLLSQDKDGIPMISATDKTGRRVWSYPTPVR